MYQTTFGLMSLILSGLLILGLLTLLVHRAYNMGRNAGLEHGAASASDRLIEKFREGYSDGYENGNRAGAALHADRLLEMYREGVKDGQSSGHDKGSAEAARLLHEKYQEGFRQGLIAGEDLGVASIEVLTDKEVHVDKGFFKTERTTSEVFIVIAGSRQPRVVRASAVLMNESEDEISKRISQMRKTLTVVGAGAAAGHPGVAAALAVAAHAASNAENSDSDDSGSEADAA